MTCRNFGAGFKEREKLRKSYANVRDNMRGLAAETGVYIDRNKPDKLWKLKRTAPHSISARQGRSVHTRKAAITLSTAPLLRLPRDESEL